MARKEQPIKDKIRDNTAVDEKTGCWVWNSKKMLNNMRRPRVVVNGVWQMAYRASYEAWVGPIPDGMYACHKCDNPLCCNPAHIFPGTAKENSQDAIQKGRWKSNAWTGTHCKNGHELSDENIVYTQSPGYKGPLKRRKCRLCVNALQRARIAKHSKKKPGIKPPKDELDRVRQRDETHCKHGHKFTEQNTKWRHEGKYWKRGCKTCQAEAAYRKYRTDNGLPEVGEVKKRYRYGA